MMKQALVFALVLLAGVNAEEPMKSQQQMAQDGLLKLMNMGVAAIREASKNVNEHAFQTGENVGKRLAEDQKNEQHSVETKMAAANAGMKDGVQGGVSMIQRGISQAEEVAEDKSVQGQAAAALAPIRANPQFNYFNQLLETFGQQANNLLEQAGANAKDGSAKGFLQGMSQGQAEEQKKLEELAKSSVEEPAGAREAKISEQKEAVRAKMDALVQMAGDVTKAGMDKAPGMLKEANAAAAESVKKASE